ncbi:MAG: Na+/H+ antiporter subunit E [Alphaproteobacteria bacterium]
MAHTLSLFVVLYVTWLALSGHFEPFLLIAGAVCCAIVVAIARRMDVIDHEGHPVHLTWRLPFYWVWLFWQIVKANLDVVSRILNPKLPIDPVHEWVPCTQQSDLGRVIFANSITLTPGTVATEVRGDRIEVHALTSEGLEQLRKGEMDARVTSLEGMG